MTVGLKNYQWSIFSKFYLPPPPDEILVPPPQCTSGRQARSRWIWRGSCEKSARSITEIEKSALKTTGRGWRMSSRGWKRGDPKNFHAAFLLPPNIHCNNHRASLKAKKKESCKNSPLNTNTLYPIITTLRLWPMYMQTTNTYVIIELDFSAMVCSICKQMSAKVKSYYTIQLMLSWLEPKNQKKNRMKCMRR